MQQPRSLCSAVLQGRGWHARWGHRRALRTVQRTERTYMRPTRAACTPCVRRQKTVLSHVVYFKSTELLMAQIKTIIDKILDERKVSQQRAAVTRGSAMAMLPPSACTT